MTGDRMINLAKTPANTDFQSKYYKPNTANQYNINNNNINHADKDPIHAAKVGGIFSAACYDRETQFIKIWLEVLLIEKC